MGLVDCSSVKTLATLVVGVSLGVVGCGTDLLEPHEPAGVSGAGSGGATAASSASAGGTGGAAPDPCAHPSDHLELSFGGSFEAPAYTCDHPGSGGALGVLHNVGPGRYEIHSCDVEVEPSCTPTVFPLSVSAPGLEADIPEGAYVHVGAGVVSVSGYVGCERKLAITSLDELDGHPNPVDPKIPVSSGGLLYLSCRDMNLVPHDGDEMLGVSADAVECETPPESPDAGPTDVYDMRFDLPGDNELIAPQGQTVTWAPSYPQVGIYEVRNLRAWTTHDEAPGYVTRAFWFAYVGHQ